MHKYEKISTAGEGAYGIVLKCKHKQTGAIVAIKQFKETDEDDKAAQSATSREVKLLRALRHENIVELKDAFKTKGTFFLIFEYIEKCMMDILDDNPKGLASETVRTFICQLGRALEHCHRHNVVHRDIKPENLLVKPVSNSLCLCDFGSARKLEAGAQMTDYVATRWYRAPELLLSSTDYGKPVDMWSFGCILGELSDGRPCFAGKTDIDQLSVIQSSVGPLTGIQLKRCSELEGFNGSIPVQAAPPHKKLEKRYSQYMQDSQLEVLKGVLVMDPAKRLSATSVLSLPWLCGVQRPGSSRPPVQPKQQRTSNVSCPPSRQRVERVKLEADQLRQLTGSTLPPSTAPASPRAGLGCIVAVPRGRPGSVSSGSNMPAAKSQVRSGSPFSGRAASPYLECDIPCEEICRSASEDPSPRERSSSGGPSPCDASIPEELFPAEIVDSPVVPSPHCSRAGSSLSRLDHSPGGSVVDVCTYSAPGSSASRRLIRRKGRRCKGT